MKQNHEIDDFFESDYEDSSVHSEVMWSITVSILCVVAFLYFFTGLVKTI